MPLPRRLAALFTLLACLAILLPAQVRSADSAPAFPLTAKRILFLGDSITHGGAYVAFIETQLRLHGVNPLPEIINIGLASETCSGLSEPPHPFPRPTVHERLDRALEAVRPDVVVACYGMNDGIYAPLSDDRFEAYRNGVNLLIDKVHAAGAKLVLLTPPPFDRVPLEGTGKLQPLTSDQPFGFTGMYADYDTVLARYAAWIMEQGDRVEMRVDLHTALTDRIRKERAADSRFTFSKDGIHPNAAGHRVMAETVLQAWGVQPIHEPDPELLKLVAQKTSLLHAAWLSHVGHQRPGVKEGLPLDEARAKAAELEQQITPLATRR